MMKVTPELQAILDQEAAEPVDPERNMRRYTDMYVYAKRCGAFDRVDEAQRFQEKIRLARDLNAI